MDAISDTNRPLSNSDRPEADASSDRGYTSDSELYVNNRIAAELIAVPAAVARGSSPESDAPPAGGGIWFFVQNQDSVKLKRNYFIN